MIRKLRWRSVFASALAFAVAVVIIVGAGSAALWSVKRLIGETNFPALTALVAIIGAVIAVNQASSASRERKARQVRSLAFVELVSKSLLFLIPFGDNEEPRDILSAEQIGRIQSRINAISESLDSLDLKELPSAFSMEGLVLARAAAKSIKSKAADCISNGFEGDFDQEISQLGSALEALQREIMRLSPVYIFGNAVLGTDARQR